MSPSPRSLLALAVLLLCYTAGAAARGPTRAQRYKLARCYRYCRTHGKGVACRKTCWRKVVGSRPKPKRGGRVQAQGGVRPQSLGSGGGGGAGGGWYHPTSGGDGKIWGNYAMRGPAGGKGNAYATYHYYSPYYYTSSLYCADAFNKILPAGGRGLLEYPWVAYCWDNGPPMSQSLCGKCAKITNPSTGQSVKVHIVDMCGQGGVDMDPVAFNAIDGNRAGVRDGHMWVDIDFVPC